MLQKTPKRYCSYSHDAALCFGLISLKITTFLSFIIQDGAHPQCKGNFFHLENSSSEYLLKLKFSPNLPNQHVGGVFQRQTKLQHPREHIPAVTGRVAPFRGHHGHTPVTHPRVQGEKNGASMKTCILCVVSGLKPYPVFMLTHRPIDIYKRWTYSYGMKSKTKHN